MPRPQANAEGGPVASVQQVPARSWARAGWAAVTLSLAACGGGTNDGDTTALAASADGRQRAAASVAGSTGSVIGNYWPNAFVVRPNVGFSFFPGPPALRRDELPGLVLPAGQGPAAGLPSVQYSARWYGLITPTVSGDYTFRLELSDKDVGTLNLDGRDVVVVSAISNRSATGAVSLAAGTPVTMKLEFIHDQGAALLKLRWKRPGSTVFEPLPASVFSKAVNLPPTITSIAAQTHYPFDAVGIPFSAADPEGDSLSLDVPTIPPEVDLIVEAANAGRFVGTNRGLGLGPSSIGAWAMRVSVTDVAGNSATTVFPWHIFPSPMSLVVNGNAELPVLKTPGFVARPPGDMIRRTGWLYRGAAGILRAGAGQLSLIEGSQALMLQGGGAVSQRLRFRNGDSFEFKTAYSTEGPAPSLNLTLDGAPLSSVTPTADWTTQRITLGCGAGVTCVAELRLANAGNPAIAGVGAPGILLDDLKLIHAPSQWVTTALPGGDFETPPLPAGGAQASLPAFDLPSPFFPLGVSWTYSADLSVAAVGNALLSGAPAPVDGRQVAVLPRLGSGLVVRYFAGPGDVLKFSATQGPANAPGAPQLIGVFVNGVQQGPALLPAAGAWTRYFVPLSIGTGGPVSFNYPVEIRAVRGAATEARAVLIDKVTVER